MTKETLYGILLIAFAVNDITGDAIMGLSLSGQPGLGLVLTLGQYAIVALLLNSLITKYTNK